MDKNELLKNLEDSRDHFLTVIDDLSDEDLEQAGVIGNWSVKDIMIHISRWEAELIKLLWQIQQNQKPTSLQLVVDLNVDEINARWYRESQYRPLVSVLDDFESVRLQSLLRVEDLSDQDLTDPKRYPWFHGEPLWKWIAEDSYEHDIEHAEAIRLWKVKQVGR